MKKKTKLTKVKTDVVAVQREDANDGLTALLQGIIAERDCVCPMWTGDAELDHSHLVRAIEHPPFIKGGEYIRRRDEYWGVLAGMLDLRHRPVKIFRSHISKRNRHVLRSAIEGLSQDQLLAYCVLIAYYLAPSFEAAHRFITELFEVSNLDCFETRLFYGLDCNLLHPIYDASEDAEHVERIAVVAGFVEIIED